MPQNKPISYDEFRETNNNFPLHFLLNNPISQMYREQPHSIRFQEEHPDLDGILCAIMGAIKEIGGLQSLPKELEGRDKGFYRAYLIMHDYGVSDEDLFK